MITRKELQDFARLKRLNLGNAEKDYLLDIALFSISRQTKNEMVFKGGTCLYKFHKLSRFSEDLDFSAVKEIDISGIADSIIAGLKNFGINSSLHEKKEPHNSVLMSLRVEGPLFTGSPYSYAKIGIDINKKSEVILPPETLSYEPAYPEVPQVNAFCMNTKEIFSEKIRALMTRRRARDLFDLYFMLQRDIFADKGLINKKMDYYNDKFDLNRLIARINELSALWKKELLGLVGDLPDFKRVERETAEKLKKIYPD